MDRLPCKVMLPPRNVGDQPIMVNPRQAQRILVMRQKRAKRHLMMLDAGYDVDHKKVGGRFTMARKKDHTRSRQAFVRPRVNGLFVNKLTELQLGSEKNAAEVSNLCERDETVAG